MDYSLLSDFEKCVLVEDTLGFIFANLDSNSLGSDGFEPCVIFDRFYPFLRDFRTYIDTSC